MCMWVWACTGVCVCRSVCVYGCINVCVHVCWGDGSSMRSFTAGASSTFLVSNFAHMPLTAPLLSCHTFLALVGQAPGPPPPGSLPGVLSQPARASPHAEPAITSASRCPNSYLSLRRSMQSLQWAQRCMREQGWSSPSGAPLCPGLAGATPSVLVLSSRCCLLPVLSLSPSLFLSLRPHCFC